MHPSCLCIFLTRECSNDKVSVTVSKLIVYCPHIIRGFHSHHVVLYLINVNVNTPLTQFYGFCKVIVAKKAWPVIFTFDIFCPCTDDPNSTVLSVVKYLFFVIVYLYIPVAGFDAIFDWYLSMLGRIFNLHIVKSTPCNQSCKGLDFLFFILTLK